VSGTPAEGAITPAPDTAPPPAGDAAAQPSPAALAPAVKPARGARAPVPSRQAAAEAAAAKTRARELQQRYTRAKAALSGGDYAAAINGLEAVLAVDPAYPDAAEALQTARAGARTAAQQAVEAGARAEAAGDYGAAINQYLFALQLDPSSAAAAGAVPRARGRMQVEGEDAYKRGRQYDALGRVSEATAMYEKAVKLLPPDHPNVKLARERLVALRGGHSN
jgi:tetratricopeptide (TPR) repeat protein